MIGGHLLFRLRSRAYRLLVTHQRALLNFSCLVILTGMFCFSLYSFLSKSLSASWVLPVATAGWMSAFLAIGILNFLIAYSVVLQRDKQMRSLKRLVLTDPLTGIYNKGYFLAKLQQEIARSRRYHHMMSLVLIDVDFFKKLNDTYGHICGDIVLRRVAKMIQGEIRFVDLAARFGGEEFAVICPETGVYEAYRIAERIRKKIDATAFVYRNQRVHLSVSIGINKFDPLNPTTEHSLFRGADEALYQAKQTGRNRSVIHTFQKSSAVVSTLEKQESPRESKRGASR